MGVIGGLLYATKVNGTAVAQMKKKGDAEVIVRPSEDVAGAVVLCYRKQRLTLDAEELRQAIDGAAAAQATLFRLGPDFLTPARPSTVSDPMQEALAMTDPGPNQGSPQEAPPTPAAGAAPKGGSGGRKR